MPDGRHLLLQAKDEIEMNEWIACINYASAFKTAGVRMRSLGLSGKDIELTGYAAAISHLQDLKRPHPSARVHTYYGHLDNEASAAQNPPHVDSPQSPTGSTTNEPLTPPMENPSRLFKATFDQVKAELAVGREPPLNTMSIRSDLRPRALSLDSIVQSPVSPTHQPSDEKNAPRLSSRSQIIRRKILDLESRISVQQAQLDSDMRFVRNISILTPFQRSTRDRLQAAIQNVAKRIMQVRLDLEKLTCHREVLANDLSAEEREWQRTKKIALCAATEKLEVERKRNASRINSSTYGAEEMLRPVSPHLESSRPHSVSASSYHSALEFAPDSARSAPDDPGSNVSFSLELPASISLPDVSVSASVENPSPFDTSTRGSLDIPTQDEHHHQLTKHHDRYVTASEAISDEQAEEWNKTRAAKRVSLVRVPSSLKMFSPKHSRDFSQVLSEDSALTVTSDLYRTRSTPIDGSVSRIHSQSDTVSLSHF
jgi:hypothetical protein